MKSKILDQIVMAIVISTLSSAGVSIAAEGTREELQREAQEVEKPRPQQKTQNAPPVQNHGQEQRERAQQKAQEQKEQRARQQQQERVERQAAQVQQQRLEQQRQEQLQQQRAEQQRQEQLQQQRVQRQKEEQLQQQRAQQQRQEQIQQQRAQQQRHEQQVQEQRQQQRLSQQRQQELVRQQQQRLEQYNRYLAQQERLARERIAVLERQKRLAQYRFQQEYLERLRQQQIYWRDHRFDYDRDPYFYTPAIYRYQRAGRYYEINEYSAKMLRQAVNYGYEEGFRAGRADRDDRWSYDYEDSYAYRDANYGYNGFYVDRDDYNYYFREGFRRGYEDGYSSRHRYGRFADDGNPSILETILTQILNFQSIG
jgi:hypothetical protein